MENFNEKYDRFENLLSDPDSFLHKTYVELVKLRKIRKEPSSHIDSQIEFIKSCIRIRYRYFMEGGE